MTKRTLSHAMPSGNSMTLLRAKRHPQTPRMARTTKSNESRSSTTWRKSRKSSLISKILSSPTASSGFRKTQNPSSPVRVHLPCVLSAPSLICSRSSLFSLGTHEKFILGAESLEAERREKIWRIEQWKQYRIQNIERMFEAEQQQANDEYQVRPSLLWPLSASCENLHAVPRLIANVFNQKCWKMSKAN